MGRGGNPCRIRPPRFLGVQLAASTPLTEPEETFARLLAGGMTPQLAYSESRIGVKHTCTVDQAQRLPGMWARVEWLKAQPKEVVAEQAKEPDPVADLANISPTEIKSMLIRDRHLARQMGQVSAAVRCTELLGKLDGMFVERTESKIDIRHAIAVRLDDAIKRVSAPKPVALPSK